MTSQSNQTEVEFAAIIFWDFVDETDDEELLSSLSELYGDDIDEYQGPYMGGGGGWHNRVAGNDTNEIETTEEFASVRTLVESNTRGILDVTTFAVLSEDQIEMVLNSDNRNDIQQLQSTLSDYVGTLPTLVDHEKPGHSGVFYAEWNGKQDLLPEADDSGVNEILDRLTEVHPQLYSFGFQTGGNLSLIRGNIFVNPMATMNPYNGLTAVRKDSHPQAEPFDELITPPPWYAEVSGLKRYYRLHTWANSRWGRLQEFDTETNDARDALSSLSSTQTDIDEVLPVSEQIQALQADYTEFRTRYDAEYQSLQDQFSERADEKADRFGMPYDIPLPSPNEPEFVDRPDDQSNSVVEYFEESSEKTFEQVDQLYTRITQKVESLVSSIESRTRLAETDENITLQKRIAWLTIVLTGLTIVLVLIEIFPWVIDLLAALS
ncbi:hypothetical protein [Natrinema salinisoli]|uniref:hypothetical protein n=1 Tax=Natrinema salinisoli TaxID=2878535 RepID=UPI001CF07CAD|nr:hypothetical protein [Natrinema salinisoli]